MRFRFFIFAAVVIVTNALADAPALKPQRVAEGVYAFIGARADVAPANHGNVINSGFIIGDDGVVVIDTGVNRFHGQQILAAIRRVTKKPVALIVNTHPHPENVLGNSAFTETGAPVVASPMTVAAMKQHCEQCLKNTLAILKDATMAGTEIVIPEPVSQPSLTVAGRKLKLLQYGWAHTEGDLAVLDVKTGVLFAGGLVSLDRIPVMLQAKTRSWIAALEQLRKEPIKILVPGHGPISSPKRMDETVGYLRSLLAVVRNQYDEGVSVLEALDHSDLPAYRRWALYPETHLLNVQHVYNELELAEFER